MNYDEIMRHVSQLYSADGKGENSNLTPLGLTIGVVVDTDDPLQEHRLRIFCPGLNDDPKKIQHLPWATKVSPFGGSINNKCYTRGNDPDNSKTAGAVQYGWVGDPEQGAHVVVGCFDGDIRRRFYVGTISEHQETHGELTGRWKHSAGGKIDGPLSSTDAPIEPQHTNLLKAFDGKNTSREWRTRAADYQVCAVREDIGQIPNSNKATYLDQQFDKISEFEQDAWVKEALGSHGYDWSGYKSLGAFLASRVYGMSTPGFHSFAMDDRPFNSRIKLRTTTGHQVILDDTNERIYVSTAEGNSWFEMDGNGNIDGYSKRRISLHAEEDINLTSKKTVRIWGETGVHVFAGNKQTQPSLTEPPADGQIRFHALDDIHVITEKTYRHLSVGDTLLEIGGKLCESIGDSMYLQVENEINILTNKGDYNLTVSANLNEMVQGDVNKFAAGTMKNASNGNAQMHSFGGKMDVGAQRTINLKSIGEDIALEAIGANEDKSGGVFMKSPQSQHGVSSEGITASTNKSIRTKAAQNIEMNNAVPTNQDFPSVPPQSIGDCALGDSVPTDGYSGADLAARLAYNAGFRGDALVTAVAIASAESGYNTAAVGDVGLENSKWGPSVGLWQIRTLKDPSAYAGQVDGHRDIGEIGGSNNAQANANLAFQLSKGGTDFRPWSTFTEGTYKQPQHLYGAQKVVNDMCNPTMMSMSQEELFELAFSAPSLSSLINSCLSELLSVQGNAFIMNGSGLVMQTLEDIAMKGAGLSTKVFSEICAKINQTAFAHDLLSFFTGTVFVGLAAGVGPGIAAAASILSQMQAILGIVNTVLGGNPLEILGDLLLAELLSDLGLNFDLQSICSLDIPSFDSNVDLIYFVNNFDVNGGTIVGTPISATLTPVTDFTLE